MRLPRRRVLLSGTALIAGLIYCFRRGSVSAYSGPKSGHFDGERFFNPGGFQPHGFSDFVRWRRTSRPAPWPEWINTPPGPPPESSVPDLRVTHINHSTVLIQVAGVNVLTDPVWSERVSPVSWAGPRRHRAPGIRFEDLPPIHIVLLSHDHYDHLDLATLKRLAAAHRPQIFAPLGVGSFLKSEGIPCTAELDWWQPVRSTAGGFHITAVPSQHFSGRGILDRNRTLWCGFVLDTAAGRVYFAGDTGWNSHFEEIRRRLGPMRLALLPIGAFEPRWFMSPVHISPDEAIRAHRALEAETSIGIHYGTFQMADDGYEEPARAIAAAGVPNFWILKAGEGRDLPAAG